jgi:hypothetical protein
MDRDEYNYKYININECAAIATVRITFKQQYFGVEKY